MTELDITYEIPYEVGNSVTNPTATLRVPENIKWDCSIGGVPFLFGMSDSFPMRRQTADFRRQRVDSEREAGEQSLDDGLWIRSWASWHLGSGLSSAEPLEIDEREARFRYATSGGVNPWTPGRLTLLNSVTNMLSSTGTDQKLIGVDSGVLHADGTTVKHVATDGTVTTVTWGGSGTAVKSIATDGTNYYAANNTGIYKGTLPSGAGSLVWNTGATPVVAWVKSRVMAAIGAGLYELVSAGPSLPTALFTHPNSGWTWTDWAEGPNAIYVSGYAGDISMIYKIDAVASSSTITLSQPVVVAEFPRGEVVRSMYGHLGSYLIIGTNKGARIATINTAYTSSGGLTIGPLVVTSEDGVLDAVGEGSFIYVTVGSKSTSGAGADAAGLYRIDLSTNLTSTDLSFPVAPDLVAPDTAVGQCQRVTLAGGKLWFSVTGTGGGVFRQDETYVTEGWLETGRIRIGTQEAKTWKDVRLLGEVNMGGEVAIRASIANTTAASTWGTIITVDGDNPDRVGSLTAVAPTPQTSLWVAVNLTTDDPDSTPVLSGYQIRAIPSPTRNELVQVPLMCFDYETDSVGGKYGDRGLSWVRYSILKSLEARASLVVWRDYTTGERATAFIEQVTLARTTPPTKQSPNGGGIVTVTMRLV